MKNNILLTGGTGFIGTHLVHALMEKKYSVHILSRQNSEYSREGLQNSGVSIHEFIEEDLLEEKLSEIKPDLVVHLASLFIAEHRPAEVADLIDSNLKYASQILDAAVNSGVKRFINTGTVWEHYNNSRSYNPTCLYAATKYAFQKIIDFYVEAHELSAVTLLLTDTYGENDKRGKLISYIKETISKDGKLKFSPGEQLIDLVHVDDVVNAYMICIERLLENSLKGHKRYTISSGEPKTLKQVIHLIRELITRPLYVDWEARPYRKREMMKSYDKGENLPDWKPEVNLQAGLSRIMEE
jgi:nucleoside-diphosphate-sugar epimerase